MKSMGEKKVGNTFLDLILGCFQGFSLFPLSPPPSAFAISSKWRPWILKKNALNNPIALELWKGKKRWRHTHEKAKARPALLTFGQGCVMVSILVEDGVGNGQVNWVHGQFLLLLLRCWHFGWNDTEKKQAPADALALRTWRRKMQVFFSLISFCRRKEQKLFFIISSSGD